MIIDLDLEGKTILVIGSGRQAERRIGALLQERCGRIIVASANVASEKIKTWGADDACIVEVSPHNMCDDSFVSTYDPFLVIAATDDAAINSMAVDAARSAGILAYRSDSADKSDYMHPAVIKLKGGITAAVFTGGQSPAVSRQICKDAESVLRDVITPSVLAQLRIQDMVRQAAKSAIPSQDERKRLLDDIMRDTSIDRLIRAGRLKDAQERAMSMLGDRS